MSLPVTFYRVASAEFNEASTWYESKRRGLGLEFIAEIDRVCRLHLNILSSMPFFTRTFGASSPNIFHTAFVFVRNNIVLLFWRYFMVAEILQFGWREPSAAFKMDDRVSSINLMYMQCIDD